MRLDCTHFFAQYDFIMMAETAEEISRKPEVRKELQRTTGEKRSEKVKAAGRDKLWFVVHALVLAGCIAAYFLAGSKLIPLPQSILGVAVRILRGAALIVIVLTVARRSEEHTSELQSHVNL